MKRFNRILIVLTVSLSLSIGSVAVASAHTRHWYDPLLKLPHADLLRAQCVIWHESRSTFANPNLGDDNGNGTPAHPQQSGIFQMNNQPGGVWDLYAMPTLHVVIWKATAFQQAQGFMMVWRVDGFGPWHAYDGC